MEITPQFYRGKKTGFSMSTIRLSAKGTDGVMKPAVFRTFSKFVTISTESSVHYRTRGGEWWGCIAATPEYYGLNVPLFRRNGYRKSGAMIAEYIRNQLEEDYAADQISIKNMQTRLRVTRIRRHKKTAA